MRECDAIMGHRHGDVRALSQPFPTGAHKEHMGESQENFLHGTG